MCAMQTPFLKKRLQKSDDYGHGRSLSMAPPVFLKQDLSSAMERPGPIRYRNQLRSLTRTFTGGSWFVCGSRERFLCPHGLSLFDFVRSVFFLPLLLIWHGLSPYAIS